MVPIINSSSPLFKMGAIHSPSMCNFFCHIKFHLMHILLSEVHAFGKLCGHQKHLLLLVPETDLPFTALLLSSISRISYFRHS